MGYSDVATVRLVLSSDMIETGGTAADLSEEQIQYELDSASAMIDSELRVAYTVPFDPVPFLIKSICTDIAAYRTDLNYRKSREYDSQNMPIILRYNMANQTLQELKKGDKTLTSVRSDPNAEGALIVHQYQYELFDSNEFNLFGPFARW
jgi:phage gp36-like protein